MGCNHNYGSVAKLVETILVRGAIFVSKSYRSSFPFRFMAYDDRWSSPYASVMLNCRAGIDSDTRYPAGILEKVDWSKVELEPLLPSTMPACVKAQPIPM